MTDLSRDTNSLDLDAANRQAFGARFEPAKDEKSLVDELLSGTVTISPHPPWEIPDEIDWTVDPFGERNWRAQFHMLRWIDPLRRAAKDGNAEAFSLWIKVAQSWTRSNGDFRQKLPFYAWADMVDGIRALALAIGSPQVARYAPGELNWLRNVLETHVEWLSDPNNLGHSNHALHQHQGLFVLGAVLRDEQAKDLAVERLFELFKGEYDDQGVNSEGAIAYHYSNFRWWRDAIYRLDLENYDTNGAFDSLDDVPRQLAHATRPSGTFVTIGDTEASRPNSIQSPYIKYVLSNGADGTPPPENILVLDRGYVFGRSGWGEFERGFDEETFFSVSFGDNNKVHGHHDGGSLTYSSLGVDWIIDPGKYEYGTSDLRSYFLDRGSHNLVSIVGHAVDKETRVELNKLVNSDDFLELFLEDFSYADIQLLRRITYSKTGEYIVVIDTVRSEEEVAAIQSWQLNSGVTARTGTNGIDLSSGDSMAAIRFSGTRPEVSFDCGETDPLSGWVSPRWKQADAATRVLLSKTGTNFRFVTILSHGFKGHPPTVKALAPTEVGAIRLEVDTGRVQEVIELDSRGAFYPHKSGTSEDPSWPFEGSTVSVEPSDTVLRLEIFKAIGAALQAAKHDTSVSNRKQLAVTLEQQFKDYRPANGFDAGLRVALADLQMNLRPQSPNREVKPTRYGVYNWSNDAEFVASSLRLPSAVSWDRNHLNLGVDLNTSVVVPLGHLTLIGALNKQPGEVLTVMFHGALDRSRTELPMFQRFRFQKEMELGPVLALSDPTLDLSDSLRLGWYLGTELVDLAPLIADVIKEVADQLACNNIILQGSSGGGFAALQVGAFIENSWVVAMNPQTDLRKYHKPSADSATEVAFGRGINDDLSHLLHRISVMERYKALGAPMRATIVGNSGDLHHLEHHIGPLLKEAENHRSNWKVEKVKLDLGMGHLTPSNEMYSEILRDVYSKVVSAGSVEN